MRDIDNRVKELVISYKTIYINTYNVIVLDISGRGLNNVVFRHESFQLWESEINGFLTSRNMDFIMVNREGIRLLALGKHHKRVVKDSSG